MAKVTSYNPLHCVIFINWNNSSEIQTKAKRIILLSYIINCV